MGSREQRGGCEGYTGWKGEVRVVGRKANQQSRTTGGTRMMLALNAGHSIAISIFTRPLV